MELEWQQLVPADSLSGDDLEDTALLKAMRHEAETFLNSFGWCGRIEHSFFGCGVGGICAVFLLEITPSREDIDNRLWVIVGDIPPAYLVTDVLPTPAEALKAYIYEMREWINAVRQNKSIENIIPVNAAPTLDNANMLETRLTMLEELGICTCN